MLAQESLFPSSAYLLGRLSSASPAASVVLSGAGVHVLMGNTLV